jgi:prolyl oligopeptidase
VRRPELYAAAVAQAPLMDMMRYASMPGGPALVPEFGSGATAEGLEALRAISAYHHVKEGAPYPAVLLTLGLNDSQVERWQPGKMAARLASATSSGKPVLLRVDAGGGQGPGATRAQHDEDLADIYSFLLWQMGDPQFQPPAPQPLPALPTEPQPAAPAQDAVPAPVPDADATQSPKEASPR